MRQQPPISYRASICFMLTLFLTGFSLGAQTLLLLGAEFAYREIFYLINFFSMFGIVGLLSLGVHLKKRDAKLYQSAL